MAPERNYGLDLLRGLMAVAVAIYHLFGWTRVVMHGRYHVVEAVGLYAVEIFFIISGASLALAYGIGRGTRLPLASFAIRRIARILPLYVLATAGTLALLAWQRQPWPDLWSIAGNFTCLFGFVDPHAAVPTGGWSLGVEMVCYTAFALIAATVGGRLAWMVALIVAVAAAFWIASGIAPGDGRMKRVWLIYTAVVNHLPFFLAGVVLVLLPRPSRAGRWAVRGVVLGMAAIVFGAWLAPHLAALAIGWPRVLCGVGCIAIAWGFLILPFTSMTAKSHARDLGDLSYGLYLLHPLTLPVAQVMLAMVPFGWLPVTLSWGPLSVASLAFGLASVAAVLCFHRIERPCMRFGRRLAPDP